MAFTIAEGVVNVTANTGKALASIGALGGGIQTITALGTAAASVAAGALAVLPAVIGAVGVAAVTAKLGMQGFSEAISSTDPAALEALAPAARETAIAFRDMKPAWDAIQQNVQQNMFAGMAGPIQQLGATYLPLLRTGLSGVATQMGGMAQQATAALMTPQSVQAVTNVLGGTQGALGGMKSSLGDVLAGFLAIAGVGAVELPAMGVAIGNVTARFKEWALAAASSGQITTIIAGAKQALVDMGVVLGNVGGVLSGVFTAMNTAGVGTMAILIQVSAALNTMVNSVSGQQALIVVFQTLNVVAGQLGQVFAAITPILGPLFTLFGQLAQTIGGMLVSAVRALAPPLTALVSAFQSSLAPVLPVISAAFGVIARAVGGLLMQAVQALAPLLPVLASAFTRILSAIMPVIPPITRLASSLFPAVAAAVTGVVIPAIQFLVPILVNLISTFVRVVTGVANFASSAINNINRMRAGVSSALTAIGSFFSNIFNNIRSTVTSVVGSVVSFMSSSWNSARATVTSAFNGILNSVRTTIGNVLSTVSALPGRIRAGLGNLGSLLLSAGRDVINGLANGIRNGIGSLLNTVRDLAGSVLSAAKSALGIASPSKVFRDQVGKQLVNGVVVGMDAMLPGAIKSATDMGNQISAAAQSSLPDVITFGSVSQKTWGDLRSQGWKGQAGDGRESLYRPGQGGPMPVNRAAASSASVTNTFYVTIDAQTVANMRGVSEFFDKIQQTARRGGTSVSGMRV